METIVKPIASIISECALSALMDELQLTPKPGLVDLENNGCHHDLSLELMGISAVSLFDTFHDIALASQNKQPSQPLREQLAAIGRYGEQKMLQATDNVNTHKGAIWCIGLLSAAAGIHASGGNGFSEQDLLNTAGRIASYHDRFAPGKLTHGDAVREKYPVISAREEAAMGFPTLRNTAIPTWNKHAAEPEVVRRLNVLLSLMAVVDDTCILHRSNLEVLKNVQRRAQSIVNRGGLRHDENWVEYQSLEQYITERWVSPGGSADLLAATIFIHKVTKHLNIN